MMPGAAAKPFHHSALLYDGDDAFLAGTVPFAREGIAAGEPVLVVLGARQRSLLRRALGADSDRVSYADIELVGRNPAQIIPALEAFLNEGPPGRPVRAIGVPIYSGRTPDAIVECHLHEALVNRAFADRDGISLLCPYDTSTLPASVIQEACCTHPVVSVDGHERVSDNYRGADVLPPAAQAPLRPPPSTARALGFDRHNLAEVRELVTESAHRAGLDSSATGEFVLGVHELAANSVRHGGGIGVLRAWVEDGAAVCEVRDSGRIEDPLAGRHAPRSGQLGGWGLWLTNAACDLVQIRSGAGGTVVRVHRRPA
ncbi:MAG: hypothetical protein AVDCRST_MAG38-1921 [uncultured Solirubrobacteraceae bacterium]|uniref:Regulator of sigma factor n=1 Tax=uncultured Solirubrobacteraceae bacterium TaxID=1162706 RepID=A0A6J4RS20_9ACTN|nr:MAG: hypothetical protein AVDCRST_MAG38-1921 [uncultured Solirubrobacteraceae bacterium]